MKNWKDIIFDPHAIVQGLQPWVECESPTWDAKAVDSMMDLAAVKCAELGATIERIPARWALEVPCAHAFPILIWDSLE